jgi:transmembrane sensor
MNRRDHLEQTAARWVVRLERGLTAAEQDEFIDWLTADPRHGDELNAQKAGWSRLNLLADWRPEHGAQPNCDLLAPPPARARRWRGVLGAATLTLAAALALGFFLGGGRSGTPRPSDRATPIALIEQRTLEDGSVVTLNRGAEIAVHYTAHERRVELRRGEAHFEVAKHPTRPFIVAAEAVDVRAVGTAFKVRLDRSAVEVLVTEGRVGVTPGNSAPGGGVPLQLAAGERTVVSLVQPVEPRVTVVSPEEQAVSLAWQPRLLEFNNTPLAAIVAEFNRANAPIRLELADVELEHRLLNAAIRSDNVEGFVRLLEAGFGVRAKRTGNLIVLQRVGTR